MRPAWDADALAQVGFDGITVIEDAGKEVYLDWEYELYGASPLFAVVAEKPVAAAEGSEAFNVLEATRDYWNERSNTFWTRWLYRQMGRPHPAEALAAWRYVALDS